MDNFRLNVVPWSWNTMHRFPARLSNTNWVWVSKMLFYCKIHRRLVCFFNKIPAVGFLVNAAVVCAILKRILDYDWIQLLEACDSLKILSIHFDLCVDATGVVCHQLGLLGTDLHPVASCTSPKTQWLVSLFLTRVVPYTKHNDLFRCCWHELYPTQNIMTCFVVVDTSCTLPKT